mgnify:CR=1 FL=1
MIFYSIVMSVWQKKTNILITFRQYKFESYCFLTTFAENIYVLFKKL